MLIGGALAFRINLPVSMKLGHPHQPRGVPCMPNARDKKHPVLPRSSKFAKQYQAGVPVHLVLENAWKIPSRVQDTLTDPLFLRGCGTVSAKEQLRFLLSFPIF